jgi:hypothetical protein
MTFPINALCPAAYGKKTDWPISLKVYSLDSIELSLRKPS